MMYDSLRNRIMPLEDDIIIYPGHGAGSACGKNMSKETTDTLGNQKLVNYALDPSLDRDSFISALLNGLTPPPEYFPQNVLMNISGYQSIDDVVAAGTTPLSLGEFTNQLEAADAVILDTRSTLDFCKGFIPGSINISLDGKFASWVGAVLRNVKQPLLLVTDIGTEEESAIRLARVGFDNVLGHLDGGFETWTSDNRQVEKIDSVTAEELATINKPNILDVRKASEFDSEHIVGAVNAPLDYWWEQESKIGTETQHVICGSGYRSVIFISLMRRRGHRNFVNVWSGMKGVKSANAMQLTEYVCPSTML